MSLFACMPLYARVWARCCSFFCRSRSRLGAFAFVLLRWFSLALVWAGLSMFVLMACSFGRSSGSTLGASFLFDLFKTSLSLLVHLLLHATSSPVHATSSSLVHELSHLFKLHMVDLFPRFDLNEPVREDGDDNVVFDLNEPKDDDGKAGFDLDEPEDDDGNSGFHLNEPPLEHGNGNASFHCFIVSSMSRF